MQQDQRFYGKFDSVSGFQTKNLVAIPLVAGDEKIGVLEVLNKAGDEPFYEDDRLLLESIAEEIAFAIRNANVCEEKQTPGHRNSADTRISDQADPDLQRWQHG